MQDRPQTGWLERWIVPLPLLAGAALAFLACCLAGHWCKTRDPYVGVERFHRFINPETLFYPTVLQLCAHARQGCAADQVLVIVGGNSILQGIWQSPEGMWTHELQRQLGPHFHVVNLAFPGAVSNEAGGVVAEILQREGVKLIYVTDFGSSAEVAPPDGLTYRYLFWDAFARGLLPADPERDPAVVRYQQQLGEKDTETLAELRRDRCLNTWLGHQELWTTFTYRQLNSVWVGQLPRSFVARRELSDPNYSPTKAERYPASHREVCLAVLRQFIQSCSVLVGQALPPLAQRDQMRVDPEHAPLLRLEREAFPPALRPQSLVLSMHDSPFYITQLTPAEQADYNFLHASVVRLFEAGGFASLDCGGDFTTEDYLDRTHLTDAGGRKLAQRVAPKLQEMARRLGYLTEDAR